MIHLHTLNGIAVSTQKNGLLPISQQSLLAFPRWLITTTKGWLSMRKKNLDWSLTWETSTT